MTEPSDMSAPTGESTGPVQDVARQLQWLAAVARRTGNAVIVTDASHQIEWVNDGFRRLTGYDLAEVRGRRPGVFLQGPDTDPAARAAMAARIARAEPFDAVVLNYAKDGRQYWVRIEAEPTRDAGGRLTGYIAIETDVTDQRVAASRERLTKRIGDRLLSCGTIEHAARIVVDALVEAYDIRAAAVWVVEPGRPTLRFVAGAVDRPDTADWMEVTSSRSFSRGTDWVVGVGAPGVAWGTAAPCQKTDFWERDQNGQFSRRAAAAQRAGIRTVCAVPVLGPAGVVAVIEFGGSHNYPGHERLPSLLEQVALQLGAFIDRHRSQRAFEAVFRHSPDALLLVDASGAVVDLNARAREWFGAAAGHPLASLLDGFAPPAADGPAPAVAEHRAHRADGTHFTASIAVSRNEATGAPGSIVSIRDLTERLRAEEALRRSLAEKVTLVQEVHHRVKNNLQILSSLVALQADALDDRVVRDALQETAHRIQSMALVHQQLYSHDDLSRIRFDDYARALCAALRASIAPSALLSVEGDPVEIQIERAVPAGIILNELVTNAFKYGRSADGRTAVRVDVAATAEGFSFTVADDGPGFGADPPRKGSMGATLIAALTRQLRARRTQGPGPGARIRIDVPHGP